MAVCCFELTFEGPLGTPVRSNTLFGHLCWALRYLEGEAALCALLEAFDEAPLRLSDGFPSRALPRPLLAPMPPSAAHAWVDANAARLGSPLEAMKTLKAFRKRRWVTCEDFLALRDRMSERALYDRWIRGAHALGEEDAAVTVQTAHNRIDRRTGTTPSEGGLYFQLEMWHQPGGPHLWLFADPGPWSGRRLRELLAWVGANGYGRDASTGRGRFSVREAALPAELFDEGVGDRWMTLSRGILTNGMQSPRYRVATHYGRLGGARATAAESPFKRPLLLVEPGSTFSGGPGPHGALLRDVHPTVTDVRENAYHLCVAFTEASP